VKRSYFILLLAILVIAAVLAFRPPDSLVRALGVTDVTAIYAKSSFTTLLSLLPGEDLPGGEGWYLTAPDGAAKFSWTSQPTTPAADCILRVSAAPFLAVGLDPARLASDTWQDGELVFQLPPNPPESASRQGGPAASFAEIIDSHRDKLAYHFQLGHYGVEVKNGNLLEWAAKPESNGLDLVFALDPQALFQAGVDRDKPVEGWILGSIFVHDASGRRIEVEKYLKPFNLI
jgi:hypothetical protein